ncbi:35779_t:CDS:2, partial [Gigaspora margarita]
FCADTDIIYIDAVNLTWITGSLICSTTFNIELLTNIKFEPNKCQTLTCKIPQKVQPDARYVALITYNNTTPISGSFFINNPVFGLIVTNPISNTDAECGNKLKVEWKDPFSKYQDLDLEIVLTTVKPPYFISSLASSVPVSSGEQIVTLPQGLENRKDYNIVLRVNRTDELGTEVYTSIFTIDGC